MAISNPGLLLNSVPASQKVALSTNYLDLSSSANEGWGQQYVPDLMEKEAEVFGPRTISGFLAQVGAEEAMTADQVVWSEQSRLHLSYKGNMSAEDVFTVTSDIDGNTDANSSFVSANHGVRVNDTVLIANANGVFKAIVTTITNAAITVTAYDNGRIAALTTAGATTLLVYGSEYGKGSGYSENTPNTVAKRQNNAHSANEPDFKTFTNKPIIMKDYYEISGSDASKIGWVEISTEGGQGGYLWYLKAESDTRARFNDYIEMAMLEAVKGDSSNNNAVDTHLGHAGTSVGTEGLFAAIESRGNVTTGVNGVNAATDLAEFDAILAEFDKQGAIEEYMMFVNRNTSLAMDDMLASMNSYGAGGTSYGVFNNSEDMALNLGFTGFRRGSYDFYKSDMRYLNDKATRGGINAANAANAIRGVMVPAGTSSVYDQTVGASMKKPFLHVRYRASQTDDRRMKTWTTGSVGAATSALDAMQLHMLTERCLITQGANNFMLMK